MGFPQLYTRKPSGFAYNHPQNPAEEASILNSFFFIFFSALQDLKEEIDIRLSRVQDIKYEPRLLAEDDSRLLQLETQGTPGWPRAAGHPGTTRPCSAAGASCCCLLGVVALCPASLLLPSAAELSGWVFSSQAAITTCTG